MVTTVATTSRVAAPVTDRQMTVTLRVGLARSVLPREQSAEHRQ
jgi:hypothetical protein